MTHYTEDQLTMKKFRNWITFAVVLAMVLSLAVGVSANTRSTSAGIYGTLRASCYQSSSVNLLDTTASVDKNPDRAYFVVTVKFSSDLGPGDPSSVQSARSVKSFNPSFAIYFNIETAPNYAFVCQEIRGGTSTDSAGYACYTQTDISI